MIVIIIIIAIVISLIMASFKDTVSVYFMCKNYSVTKCKANF